ncbi:ATP-dependent helicase [Corynebacterium confusum]
MSKANYPHLSPDVLAASLGKKFPPSPEQAQVIDSPLGPKLVVAGAGAGKTETMASRVVSLVANGLVRPEEILGLTFTKKAALQLENRIRRALVQLRETGMFPPGSPVADALETIAPKVATYDSYAGDLVREYGLLVPVEPGARIITDAERFALAHEVVTNYTGRLSSTSQVGTVTEQLVKMVSAMDNVLADPEDIRQHAKDFRAEVDDLPKGPRTKGEYSKKLQGYLDTQQVRVDYLELVEALQQAQRDKAVVTFGEQMAVAAKLAAAHPTVGAAQRSRFRVVLLDEYQDTSHSQRVLLRALFGGESHPGLSVTAVGDPMQSIYGWRGATAENLAAFVTDFPKVGGEPADKDQLTISWRNPRKVLEMANAVADGVFAGGPRPVDPLRAHDHAGDGEVSLGFFANADAEMEFVAGHLREKYAAAQEEERDFSAAVLVRTNKQAQPVARALEEAGVPYEIAGLGGLLFEPEVQDLVALATMLIRPQNNTAALRVLAGPACGIGLKDIQSLGKRAANLAGRLRHPGEEAPAQTTEQNTDHNTEQPADQAPEKPLNPSNPEAVLRAELDDITAQAPEQVLGLADAVADLGERERYTPEGLARIEELSSRLRYLRTYSLAKPLGDLFADIEAVFNLRTEVLARGTAGAATHLDAFAGVVESLPVDGLGALLDYLELAKEHENALEPGEVPKVNNRVQILTAHKAKGLEWEHVCVVRADKSSYQTRGGTFLSQAAIVPGDDDYIEVVEPEPNVKGEVKEATRSDFEKGCEAYKREKKEHLAQEAARLFYVAMTRSESTLTVTGSFTGKREEGVYEQLELLRDKFPDAVVHWDEGFEDTDAEQAPEAGFPVLPQRPGAQDGARRVAAAMEKLPELSEGEAFAQWEAEVNALIEEYRGLQAPVVEVALPGELTASDLVALRADPVQFARRQRRPVPFKPNSYAKRGTAFHAWLEERFGGQALLSEDELPGIDEPVPAADLVTLKEKFLDSDWANRTPEHVEAPFEVTIGSAVVRGRIDAVFREPDGGWLVVDWKTGRPPQGADMQAAQIQLAVYAEAWRRLTGVHSVRAAFHYVADNYTLEPRHLPDGPALARLLSGAVHPE